MDLKRAIKVLTLSITSSKYHKYILATNFDSGECTSSKAGSGRNNGNDVDLNRAFPTWDDLSLSKEDLIERREPEVSAVIDWVLKEPFVLSGSLFDGAVVANYPYDDSHSNERSGIKVCLFI